MSQLADPKYSLQLMSDQFVVDSVLEELRQVDVTEPRALTFDNFAVTVNRK